MTLGVAIVTGASRGVGHSIVSSLLSRSRHSHVISISRTPPIPSHQTTFGSNTPQYHWFSCDITHEENCRKMMDNITRFFGEENSNNNLLINCAGISSSNLLLRSDSVDINSIFKTNVYPSFFLSKLFIKQLLKKKSTGCIINFGSIVGQEGNPGQTAYSASKSALTGFTKSLAQEVGTRNIRVNMISPGFIQTDMTKDLDQETIDHVKERTALGRLGSCEDIISAVHFIEDCNYLTGQVIVIDGGLHWAKR